MSALEQRTYAVRSLGRGQYCWMVWRGHKHQVRKRLAEVVASGQAEGREAAIAAAKQAAGGPAWVASPWDVSEYLPKPPPDTKRYSICSTGGRWFWCVWPGGYFDRGDPLATGYAATRDEAEAAAKHAAGEGAWDEGAGSATYFHRQKSVEKRATKRSRAGGTAKLEFVYHSWWDDEGRRQWSRNRIVKRTAKRVYVESRSYYPERDTWRMERIANGTDQWTDHDIETFVLDREELEREGCVFGGQRGVRTYYYLQIPQERPYTPPCLETLGLSLPCSAEEVRRAYRRKARELHPDAGGDAETFMALEQAYQQALGLVEQEVAR